MSSFIALVIPVSPAAAHDGTAIITVESQTVEQMSVSFVMRAVWDNDGHAAADATATVVAETPAGERVGPVTMEPTDDDGRYAATLEFPAAGDWNVRFTVVTPPGTLEITQTVPAADDVTAPTTATTTPQDTSPSTTDDTTASAVAAEPETAAASQNDAEQRPTSNTSAALFFFIVAAIIFGACLLAYRSRGERSARQPPSRPRDRAATGDPAGHAHDASDTAEGTSTDSANEADPTADAAAGVDTKDTPAE